jgi:signal peptidase I
MSETELQDTAKTPEEETVETAETEGRKKKKKEKVKRPLWREILSWVLTLLCAFAAAIVIRSIIFEPVRVDGESMDDTLANGEIMLVSKYDYNNVWLCLPWQSDNASQQAPRFGWGNPNFLDVVICRYPARGAVNFVKRVVGLPGETVALSDDGYLLINGVQIPEEAKLAGIEEDFRLNYGDYAAYYIPKKGDKAVISQSGLTDRDGVSLYINGQRWFRRQTCLVLQADGKTLKLYNRNTDDSSQEMSASKIRTEAVISYDGKISPVAGFLEAHPEMLDKEFTVGEDYYFVMGDHRDNSNDSRSVGVLERSAIVGHARNVVFPFNKWRGVE